MIMSKGGIHVGTEFLKKGRSIAAKAPTVAAERVAHGNGSFIRQ
jgi:hypothetical protein